MDITFVAGGGLRGKAVFGQTLDKIGGDFDGIDQPASGISGMSVAPLEGNDHTVSRKGLGLDLSHGFAIQGVGVSGAKFLHIEVLRSAADLFVGRKGDADGAVGNLGMGHQVLGGPHDFGHAGLVIGP